MALHFENMEKAEENKSIISVDIGISFTDTAKVFPGWEELEPIDCNVLTQ